MKFAALKSKAMNAQDIDERIIRVTDILQQVLDLDGMIALHRDKSQDGFMLRQYEYMRGEFMKELKTLLENMEIMPAELAAA